MAEPVTPPADAKPVTPPAEPPPWTSSFNDDQKAFVLNKGYKGPADVIDSYRNLEKLHGVPAERLLKLPESMDTPEGRAIFERLGAPKEAKEYGLEAPKGTDPKITETLTSAFHEAGITKTAAQKIMAKLVADQEARNAQALENAKAAVATGDLALKKDWGAAYEQNTNLAKEAARVLGMTEAQVNALGAGLGHEATMKLFHKLSGAVRESDFIGGRPPAGILAPEQAKSEIKNLRNDADFSRRLLSGETEAKQKWERLHQQAFVGEYSF